MTASTPEIEADRQRLIALISDEAVFHGDFTLSSGKQANYYVDMRKLTLDHRAAPAIGRIMLDLIADIPDVASVGGLTLGADPIANSIMHESVHAGRPLEGPRSRSSDRGRGCRGQACRRCRRHVDHGSVGAESRRGAASRGCRGRCGRRDRGSGDRGSGGRRGRRARVARGDRAGRPGSRSAVSRLVGPGWSPRQTQRP